jgi:flavin-dependent dehydrogenase
MQKRIAIIGGGPGGLSAAVKAAESGFEVHLFEKGEIGSGIMCAEGFIDTLGVLNKPAVGVLFKVERVNFFSGTSDIIIFSQRGRISPMSGSVGLMTRKRTRGFVSKRSLTVC